jgi:hypothetical protein
VNKLIAFAAIAAVLTMSAPTFAQSYDPSVGTGNIVHGGKGGMETGRSAGPLYNYAPGSRHNYAPRSRRELDLGYAE